MVQVLGRIPHLERRLLAFIPPSLSSVERRGLLVNGIRNPGKGRREEGDVTAAAFSEDEEDDACSFPKVERGKFAFIVGREKVGGEKWGLGKTAARLRC